MRSQSQRRAARGANTPFEAPICPHDSCCHEMDQLEFAQSCHFVILNACSGPSIHRPPILGPFYIYLEPKWLMESL